MDEPGKDTEKRKAQIIINRPAFNNDDLRIYAGFEKRQITMKEWIKLKAKELFSVNFVKVLFNFFPFLEMFTTYQCSYFLNDFLAGLTVGIMHIPQGDVEVLDVVLWVLNIITVSLNLVLKILDILTRSLLLDL